MPALVVGTRGSELALVQAREIVWRLKERNPSYEFHEKVISTSGDEGISSQKSSGSGKDAFTKEIDAALGKGDVDIAVHSLKDVPSYGKNNDSFKIELVAFPPRESPFDVLICHERGQKIGSLRKKARIGTGSIRRSIQLKLYRPDFDIVELHGNVTTRIRKLRSGKQDLDALVLAEAGLKRLGLESEIDEVLSSKIILPAVGQGALAVSVRADDPKLKRIVKSIDDLKTRQCVTAERRFSAEFGGGCNTPVAALATMNRGIMNVEGMISGLAKDYSLGAHSRDFLVARRSVRGPASNPLLLGKKLAKTMRDLTFGN